MEKLGGVAIYLGFLMLGIILDKSYLDAASPTQINSLCDNHVVLMSETLFYELTTTNERSMKNCFNKFPDRNNPVALIPNIGDLLSYEASKQKACTPLYERRIRVIFEFNNRVSTGTFEWTPDQIQARDERRTIVEKDTKKFFELAMMSISFFPFLNGVPFKKFPQAVQKAQIEVASNEDKIKQIYSQLPQDQAPPKNIITPDWAYFRWLQVRLIYSLDLLLKYQGMLPAQTSPKFWRRIEHDMLDAEYIILGALVGGLACNEKKMIETYKIVCPDGLLFRC